MSHDPTALDDAEEDAEVAEEFFDAFDTFSVTGSHVRPASSCRTYSTFQEVTSQESISRLSAEELFGTLGQSSDTRVSYISRQRKRLFDALKEHGPEELRPRSRNLLVKDSYADQSNDIEELNRQYSAIRAEFQDLSNDPPTRYNGPASDDVSDGLPMPVQYNGRNQYLPTLQEFSFEDQPMGVQESAESGQRTMFPDNTNFSPIVQRRFPGGDRYRNLIQDEPELDIDSLPRSHRSDISNAQ